MYLYRLKFCIIIAVDNPLNVFNSFKESSKLKFLMQVELNQTSLIFMPALFEIINIIAYTCIPNK